MTMNDYQFFMKAFEVYLREYLCKDGEDIKRECERYAKCQQYVYNSNFK